MKYMLLLAATCALAACGDDDDNGPAAPPVLDVRGTYELTNLSFDPQGSLPDMNLLTRIDGSIPTLVLAHNGRGQLVFRDPDTGLVTLADASYSVTSLGGVRLEFDESTSLYRKALLSRVMVFSFDATSGSLVFADTPPDGVDRARLIQLVPEWTEEQLFDPVPGRLTVVYRQS